MKMCPQCSQGYITETCPTCMEPGEGAEIPLRTRVAWLHLLLLEMEATAGQDVLQLLVLCRVVEPHNRLVDIATFLQRDYNRVLEALDQLQRRGLVSIQTSRRDSRRRIARVTDKGQTFIKALSKDVTFGENLKPTT